MCYVYRWVNSTAIFFDTKDIFYSVPCKYFKGLSWNEVTCYTWAFKRPFVSFQMNGVFSSFSEKNHWLKQWEKKILMSILSDLFSLRQAKFELVKIQIQIFPHGLEVHLDIFWVLVWFLPWAEISGMQIFGLQEQSQEGVCLSLNYLSPQDFYSIVLFLIITFTFEIGFFSIK